jgi:hypothetical protein
MAKRRMWKVKIEEEEELPTSPVQRAIYCQGPIEVEEVSDTNNMDNRLMPRAVKIARIRRTPFLELRWILVHGNQ